MGLNQKTLGFGGQDIVIHIDKDSTAIVIDFFLFF